MKTGILGRKVGMTQVFDESGATVPVTVVDTSDCMITQIKGKQKEGYAALQLGIGTRKPQNVKKSQQGHFKKAGIPARARTKELRVGSEEEINHLKPGSPLSVEMFSKGDRVDVTGTSKGKGFAGVMKRHGYKGTKASHGVHEVFRHGGSIGATTSPGRVLKGVGMPGQLGNTQSTVQNIEVVEVRPKDKLLVLKGALPGSKSGIVLVRNAKKHPEPSEKRAWVK